MVAKSVKWVLAGLMVSPTAALALGLGDIHLLSTLNAPLNADIDLVGATPDELASLTPKVASRDTFAQHGLDWPAFLANVTVHAVHTRDGRDVLELRSTEPVTEPFLTVLVELDWDRGHFVREYTMLFDPPVYTPGSARLAHQTIQAPTSGGTAHEGTVQRTKPRAGSAPAATAGKAEGAGGPAAGGTDTGTYQVHRGDTLSRIAAKLGGGDRIEERRWMVAAFQANPDAFEHNMNLLRSGSVLRIPSEAAVAAVSAAQASVEVHRQYVAWRGASHPAAEGAQSGHLRLVAPTQASGAGGAAGPGVGGAGGDVKSLQGEVQSLQAQLEASRRLLDMRNAQLAQLQAKLAARTSAEAAISTSTGASSATSTAPAEPIGPAASTSSAAPATPAASDTAHAPATAAGSAASTSSVSSAASSTPASERQATPAAAVTAARHPAQKPVRRAAASPHPASAGSWLDSLGNLGWALGAIVVALLGFLGFRAWNSRRKAGFDDSLGRLAEASATSLGASPPTPAARELAFPQTAPQMAPKRDSGFVVEETGTHERPRFESVDEGSSSARHVEADDTISSETAINLDQGDPLAEADFHMAYGLYDQAADLIRIAIQREPERRELKLKLLEVFFVWGNKEQFLATARDLAESREHAAPGEWDKIVIMGKQLAPDDPLFAGGAAVSGAAAGGVDLDLEGGQDRIDFDVLGNAGEASDAEGVDLDIGTAIGERDPAAEAAAQRATDRNLALDEQFVLPEDSAAEPGAVTATQQMLGADAMTGSTREMTARTRELAAATREMTATLEHEGPAPHEATWESEEEAREAPTVEQPMLVTPDNPTIRQKVEMALRAGAGEHTTELALDDLGLDLTALASAPEISEPADAGHDTLDQPALAAAGDAPTMVAGLDEHSRRLMENAERRSAAAGDLKVSETGTWHFDADPFAGGEGTALNGALEGDVSETSRLTALKPGTLDFELGDTQAVVRPNGAGDHVDLDVGAATVPDVAFTATTKLGTDDLALPELDPVTMSEVGTKLDLARAYMDMGDPEGARNILEEVMNEGSVAQKQEAERLISSLPG